MEDISPERLRAEQFIAGLFGDNIDDRNRPFIERSAEFNRLVGGTLALKKRFRIPDECMDELLGYMLDLVICIGNSRVDTPEEPPEEELES